MRDDHEMDVVTPVINSSQEFLRIALLEETLDPLRRNLDDFFLVVLAIITFGEKVIDLFPFCFVINQPTGHARNNGRSTDRISIHRSRLGAQEKRNQHPLQEHSRWL